VSDIRVYKRLAFGFAMLVVCVTVLALGGSFVLKLTAPSLLAFLFAWLLDPLVRLVNRKTALGHKVCSIIVSVVCFVIVGAAAFFLIFSVVNELMKLASNLDSISKSIEDFAASAISAIRVRTEKLPDSMGDQLVSAVKNMLLGIKSTYLDFIGKLTKGISGYALKLTNWIFFIVAFIAGTLMFSFRMPMYRAVLAQSTGSDPDHPINLVKKILRAGLGGYLRATIILGCYVGVLCMIAFFLIGQEYAVLLAILMGIADIIPNFGATVILLPWAVVAFIKGNASAAVILAVTAGVSEVTRNMIYPKVMGNQTGLSPLLTVISSFVGWKISGVMGMIIGPIVALIIVNIYASGIFEGPISDLKVLYRDVTGRLRGSSDSSRQ